MPVTQAPAEWHSSRVASASRGARVARSAKKRRTVAIRQRAPGEFGDRAPGGLAVRASAFEEGMWY